MNLSFSKKMWGSISFKETNRDMQQAKVEEQLCPFEFIKKKITVWLLHLGNFKKKACQQNCLCNKRLLHHSIIGYWLSYHSTTTKSNKTGMKPTRKTQALPLNPVNTTVLVRSAHFESLCSHGCPDFQCGKTCHGSLFSCRPTGALQVFHTFVNFITSIWSNFAGTCSMRWAVT